MALIDIQQLGAFLKDAADAVKHLADAIAHIVRLGDAAWSEISARTTRRRLMRIYRAAGWVYLRQAVAITMLDPYLPGQSGRPEYKNFVYDDFHWTRDWRDVLSHLEPLTRRSRIRYQA